MSTCVRCESPVLSTLGMAHYMEAREEVKYAPYSTVRYFRHGHEGKTACSIYLSTICVHISIICVHIYPICFTSDWVKQAPGRVCVALDVSARKQAINSIHHCNLFPFITLDSLDIVK